MNEKEKAPLTQEQIDHALNVLLRAANAGQTPTPAPTPRVDGKMNAWHKQREMNKALIEECRQSLAAAHQLIHDVLPKEYLDLFVLYSSLVVAELHLSHYSAAPVTYQLYKDLNKRAKALVKRFEKRKARGTS